MVLSLSLNLAFGLYLYFGTLLLNDGLLLILFPAWSFSLLLSRNLSDFSFFLSISFLFCQLVSLLVFLCDFLKELVPKSNLTVGMWTNSGWLVGLKLLLVSGLPLVAWVDWKAWDVVLVVFVGFLFFNEDSVVVDWGIWPAEKAPTSSVSFVLNK